MKKLSLLFFILMLGMGAFAQTTYYWRDEATNGNWNKAGNWRNGTNITGVPGGNDILIFGNDFQTTMTNDLPGTVRYQIIFTNSATQSRIITGIKENSFQNNGSNYAKIENNSSANQTIDFPLNWGYSAVMELKPVSGDLTIKKAINNNGKMTDVWGGNGNTLSIASMSGTGGLTIKNNPTTVKITGTSTYTGNTNVDYGTLELQADVSSAEIIVKSGAKLVINGNDVDVKKLTINSGGTVEVLPGKSLTVNGVLTNNGILTLKSDANGTATIITKGTVSAGTYNINQYLTLTRRTWYMSSPVANAQPVDMNWIKYYDEATNSWLALYDSRTASQVDYGTNSFVTGKGYSVTPNTEITNILFAGALNTGEKTIELQKDGSTSQAGFNFVGNPYPSYIDWKAMVTKNSTVLETNTMWYRSKIEGSFKFYTVDGAGVVVPSTSPSITAFVPPMQGFWVKTNADASTLYFEDNMRSHAGTVANPSPNPLKAPAATQSELSLLRLQVSNGTNTDEAVIYSYASATDGYDFYDSPKMMNSDAAIPEIYTTLNNQPIVINVMNNLPLDTEIGLAFVPGDATSFSLRASEITNLPSDVKVILKDYANNGLETDLSDGVAVYNFAPATTTGDRFSVIFRSAGSTTAVNTNSSKGISVYSVKNGINVTVNAELVENATVRVFNAVGQQLANQHLTNHSTTINGHFNPGVYVIKISNGTTVTATQKIVIK